MRHRKHTFKIGRKPAHRRALLANMVCSLIKEERIETTVTRAKEARRLAEKMVTLGKRGTLHTRRRAIAILGDRDAVARLFAEVAPRFVSRDGGYTRILKTGTRRGDAAEMCLLEFVGETPAVAAAEPSSETEETTTVAEPASAESDKGTDPE